MEETELTQSEGKKSNVLLGMGLAVLFAAAAFFSGLQIGGMQVSEGIQQEAGIFSFLSSATKPSENADLEEFWRVWNLLEKKFVAASSTESLSTEERLEGAILGLTKSYGDPYTVFFPPVKATEFEENISGNFSGVGMEVGIRDSFVVVIAPLPDTPAETAGIIAGDIIVKIDDEGTEGMNIDAAVKLIRGEKGTEVVLSVFREGETDFIDIPIIRDTIDIPTIRTTDEDGVFTISLYSFNALAEAKMQKAAQDFVNSDSEQLVLDLRGNPGGFLQSAVSIAGLFLPAGKVVVRESFAADIDEQVYRSSGGEIFEFNPDNFVVLVDGGSASASEILAGALKEHGVATVIGKKTFGKGSVQELVDLPTGSSLKVTVARWLSPDGISFSANGLEPNVTIERTPQQIMEKIDPQLEAALAWLGGKRDFEPEEEVIEEEIAE